MIQHDDIETRILDATRTCLLHYGYDKTTVNDIIKESGIARSTLYTRWKRKDEICQAAFWREVIEYSNTWFHSIQSHPDDMTLVGLYKHALITLQTHPFMQAILRQDMHVKRLIDNLNLPSLYQERVIMMRGFLEALQKIGAVRQDIHPASMAYLMTCIKYGILEMSELVDDAVIPDLNDLMQAMVDMVERALEPDDITLEQRNAGRQIIKNFITVAQQRLEEMALSTMPDK